MWENLKTQVLTKLKDSNCEEKKERKKKIVTEINLKLWQKKTDTQKLNLWLNLKTKKNSKTQKL